MAVGPGGGGPGTPKGTEVAPRTAPRPNAVLRGVELWRYYYQPESGYTRAQWYPYFNITWPNNWYYNVRGDDVWISTVIKLCSEGKFTRAKYVYDDEFYERKGSKFYHRPFSEV